MKRPLKIGLTLLLVVFIGYALRDAKNRLLPPPIELAGAQIGPAQIADIVKESGIRLPPDVIGLNYLYIRTRDPIIYAKFMIPKGREEAFFGNAIFSIRPDFSPFILSANEKPWWRPRELNDLRQVRMSLPGPAMVECSAGRQGGDLIVYIAWMRP